MASVLPSGSPKMSRKPTPTVTAIDEVNEESRAPRNTSKVKHSEISSLHSLSCCLGLRLKVEHSCPSADNHLGQSSTNESRESSKTIHSCLSDFIILNPSRLRQTNQCPCQMQLRAWITFYPDCVSMTPESRAQFKLTLRSHPRILMFSISFSAI